MPATDPIYIETYYIQRKKIVGKPPVSGSVIATNEMGYKLLPGRIVNLWIYNATAAMFQEVGTFFEPVEFTDQRLASFVSGADGSGQATTSNPDVMLHDNFRLKFTDDSYVPFVNRDDDGGPALCSGFYDESVSGEKILERALASGG